MQKLHLGLLATMIVATSPLSMATDVTVNDVNIAKVSDFAPAIELSQKQLVVIQFHTRNCGPCSQMSREMKNFERILRATTQAPVYIARIFIGNTRHPLHNNRLVPGTGGQPVQSFPTIVILKNGSVVWRSTGVTKAQALLDLVTQHNFAS